MFSILFALILSALSAPCPTNTGIVPKPEAAPTTTTTSTSLAPIEPTTEAPIAPTYPTKPLCTSAVVLLPSAEAETDCNVEPPQILAYWAHDPGPLQVEECNDHGGQFITTRFGEQCYDIDY